MHKLLERKRLFGHLKECTSLATIVEDIIESTDIYFLLDVLMERFVSGDLHLFELFNILNARLHRTMASQGLVNVRELCTRLLNTFNEQSIKDAMRKLFKNHPELIPYMANLMMALDEKEFLLLNLWDWIHLPVTNVNPVEWLDMLINIVEYLLQQQVKDEIKTIYQYIPSLLQSMWISHNPVVCYEKSLAMLNKFFAYERTQRVLCSKLSLEFAMAIIELVVTLKTSDPKLDCTLHLNFICKLEMLEEVPPFFYMILTHPMFTEVETISILKIICSQKDKTCPLARRIAGLMLLAEYPMMKKDHEQLLYKILVDYQQTDSNYDFKTNTEIGMVDSSDTGILIKNRLLLLMSSMFSSNFDMFDKNWKWDDLDYAFAAFSRLGINYGQAGNLAKMLSIVLVQPCLAQRLFFLVLLVLRNVPSSSCSITLVITEAVKVLIGLSKIDDFCRIKSLNILKGLINASYTLRALILPVCCDMLKTNSQLFDLINESLASLVFSADSATLTGVRAFSVCVLRIARLDSRQSYLKYAFSSIQSVFKASGKSIKDLDAKSCALLFVALEELIRVKFISPKLVWNEILKEHFLTAAQKDTNELFLDLDFVGQFYSLASCMALLVPDDFEKEQDFSIASFDKTISAVIVFLKNNLSKHPEAALCGLAKFPPALLEALEINLVNEFIQFCSSKTIIKDHERLDKFLSRWITMDIKEMSRSLFIGTTTAAATSSLTTITPSMRTKNSLYFDPLVKDSLSSQVSSWTTNPALAIVKLQLVELTTAKELASFLVQIINLPALSLQHWVIRLYFIKVLELETSRLVLAHQDSNQFESIVKDLELLFLSKITGGQTVSSIVYSLLIWSIMVKLYTKYVSNKSYALTHLERLLTLVDIPTRFQANDEIMGTIIVVAKMLSSTTCLEDDQGEALVIEKIKNWKITKESWTWFNVEMFLGNAWPAVMQNRTFTPKNELEYAIYEMTASKEEAITEEKGIQGRGKKLIEPIAFKGVQAYFTGIAAVNATVATTTLQDENQTNDWIKTQVKDLLDPGPATRKVDTCIALAGFLGIGYHGSSNPIIEREIDIGKLILTTLQQALCEASDLRLSSWLLVLIARIALTRNSMALTEQKSQHKTANPWNRFGVEKPFGICMEMICNDISTSKNVATHDKPIDVSKSKDTFAHDKLMDASMPIMVTKMASAIIIAMSKVEGLPRIDWTFCKDQLTNDFLLGHLKSTQFNSVYFNQSISNLILERIESNTLCTSLLGAAKIGDLLDSFDKDQPATKGTRLLLAIQSELLENADILIAVVKRSSLFDPHVLLELISKVKYDSLELWNAISDANLYSAQSPLLVKFLKSQKLEDAINVVTFEPSTIPLVAKALGDPKLVPELANIIYLAAIDQIPFDAIQKLFLELVSVLGHPMIKHLFHRSQLSWIEFCRGQNEVYGLKVIRIFSKIATYLEGDSEMAAELFLITTFYR